MNAASLIQLVCHECGWRPRAHMTMGLVNAHYETEHSEVDTSGPVLDMVVVCPKCDFVAPLTRDEGRRTIHDCPQCRRTYRIPAKDRP